MGVEREVPPLLQVRMCGGGGEGGGGRGVTRLIAVYSSRELGLGMVCGRWCHCCRCGERGGGLGRVGGCRGWGRLSRWWCDELSDRDGLTSVASCAHGVACCLPPPAP